MSAGAIKIAKNAACMNVGMLKIISSLSLSKPIFYNNKWQN